MRTRQSNKPHLVKKGGYWCVFAGRLMVSCWPTIETAWLRYTEWNTPEECYDGQR